MKISVCCGWQLKHLNSLGPDTVECWVDWECWEYLPLSIPSRQAHGYQHQQPGTRDELSEYKCWTQPIHNSGGMVLLITDLTFPAKVLKFALLVINCVKYFVPKYEFLCGAASSGPADKGVSVFRVSLWLHDLIATVACRGGGAKKVRVDVSIFLIVSWMMRKYRM